MKNNDVIGIDPGAVAGWAVVRGGLAPRLRAYGKAEIDYDNTATKVLADIGLQSQPPYMVLCTSF